MELALIGAAATVAGALLAVILQGFFERRERERQKWAVARALLFEIDHFYRFYICDVERSLCARDWTGCELSLSSGGWHGSVYRGNCGRLGELPERLTEGVVHFYGIAEGHVEFLLKLVRHIHSNQALAQHAIDRCKAVASMAFLVSGLLSFYAGVPFEMPTVAVAADVSIDDETRSNLKIGIAQLNSQFTWSQRLARRFRHRPQNSAD